MTADLHKASVAFYAVVFLKSVFCSISSKLDFCHGALQRFQRAISLVHVSVYHYVLCIMY